MGDETNIARSRRDHPNLGVARFWWRGRQSKYCIDHSAHNKPLEVQGLKWITELEDIPINQRRFMTDDIIYVF